MLPDKTCGNTKHRAASAPNRSVRETGVTELEREIERQRASDELRAIMSANVAQLPNESYENNLRRRAELELRKQALLSKLTDF